MSTVTIHTATIIIMLMTSIKFVKNMDALVADLCPDKRDAKRLSIVLSIISKEVESPTPTSFDKLNDIIESLDEKFTEDYIFVLIVITMKDIINDYMVGFLEYSEQSSSQEYLLMCDQSKEIVENFRNLERYLKQSGKWKVVEKFSIMFLRKKN